MRWDKTLPHAVSGWCFWVSFVALVTVIAVTLAGATMGVAGVEGAAEVLLRVVQFGFAGVVASFVLGVVCSQVEQIRRNSRRG
jgi:hypothetical protein